MLLIAGSPQAGAQEAQHPAIAAYGAITLLPEAAHRPSADQPIRALFEISSDASGPGDVTDHAYRSRFGTANPHPKLIEALQDAGVELHVCGQALARQGIPDAAVDHGITIDFSAMTTLVLLQQRGWSLVSD
jgi:hypothetical protein